MHPTQGAAPLPAAAAVPATRPFRLKSRRMNAGLSLRYAAKVWSRPAAAVSLGTGCRQFAATRYGCPPGIPGADIDPTAPARRRLPMPTAP